MMTKAECAIQSAIDNAGRCQDWINDSSFDDLTSDFASNQLSLAVENLERVTIALRAALKAIQGVR